MTANRSSPYQVGAIVARFLPVSTWILFLSFLLLPPISLAQSPDQKAALAEGNKLINEATQLRRAGKLSQAESILRRALAIVEILRARTPICSHEPSQLG